jgi:hypothetical protein
MTLSRSLLGGFFAVAAVLAGNALLAAPSGTNPGTPFQMLADQHLQIQEKVDEVARYNAVGLPETLDRVEFAVRLPMVAASIDPTACAAGFPACGANQGGPATDQNRQPIRMVVLVARDGVGVEGLSADDFRFENPFPPVGGPSAVPCESNCGPMWFQEGGSGLYAMFLEPAADGNWRAGQYAAAVSVELAVTDPYTRDAPGTTLVTFEIPPALGPID